MHNRHTWHTWYIYDSDLRLWNSYDQGRVMRVGPGPAVPNHRGGESSEGSSGGIGSHPWQTPKMPSWDSGLLYCFLYIISICIDIYIYISLHRHPGGTIYIYSSLFNLYIHIRPSKSSSCSLLRQSHQLDESWCWATSSSCRQVTSFSS